MNIFTYFTYCGGEATVSPSNLTYDFGNQPIWKEKHKLGTPKIHIIKLLWAKVKLSVYVGEETCEKYV